MTPSLTISPVDDGAVQVTVTIPADQSNHFVNLFNSLSGSGATPVTDSVPSRPRNKTISELDKERAEQAKAAYFELIAGLFDKYTAEGFKRNDAIKRIAADLRARNHCWSSTDLVRSFLPAAGRPGTRGPRPEGVS
ncbi:hypothetical protein HTZ97_13705 [Desulfuromonas acetoxidans]|uniref:Uncharacterized protein n=1 Tax=Desulfuromonas acetoxidans (strain DSM 684 / 11070) TaxID=281689 RepID=Q1K1S9_DESA6|nr:hypothetical protein [Desulfuromonas acetoxidans]EAT16309.1 conserved hypothetical protein [Desulfuromonas acetoxidans DSM 684]MBF0644874.1 hypothetical protein [Desulfuromonas acetoxidans]NVD25391.1 hypothetical protein [Desulfuromonas acetoxidans]NVE17508.1 hypothetical protein [Desulfuromonas acetoxidans]